MLRSTVLAERDSSLQIRTIEYEGVPRADGIVEMVDSTLRVVPLGSAFGAAHYDSLFRFGFIRRNTPGVTTYYAPNAQLLAHERFAATHCFSLAPEDTLADDVVGTAKLDVTTYKLRRIDFAYVNPPPAPRAPRVRARGRGPAWSTSACGPAGRSSSRSRRTSG